MASPSVATTGMPFGIPSRNAPASAPAHLLSMTLRISYFSECRTRPLPVLPSCSPNWPSQ